MSYILDALRKADSERERGSVPGLHTQPVPPPSAPAPAARRGVPAAAVAGVGALVLAGVLAWIWLDRDGVPAGIAVATAPAGTPAAAETPAATAVPAGTEAPAAMPPPTAPAVAAAPAAAPAPAPPAPPAPPAVAVPPPAPRAVAQRAESRPPPAPEPAARPPAPRQSAQAPLGGAPRTPTVRTAAAPARAPAAQLAMPDTGTADASDAQARVYKVDELPEDIRRGWPKLSIGGSIYSETPASRFLIINGRIFHEGDAVASDLSLEQIRLKAAVLRYKGYRVGITY